MMRTIGNLILDNPEKFLIVCFIIAAILIGSSIRQNNKNTARLMAQCMADGHKEYECVGILRNNESAIVVPVYTR